MIRPDDRTPEDRRADLEADIATEAKMMTDEQIQTGLTKAMKILTRGIHMDCMLAIVAATARMDDMRTRISELESQADDAHYDAMERDEKADR